MENIELKDVGLGYEQCSNLNKLVTDKGEKLLSEFTSTILSLQKNWIGADATEHINNLIKVRDALKVLLEGAKRLSAAAGDCIIDIQSVIKANGGAITVGSALGKNIASVANITECAPTTQYHVDPAALTNYNELTNECGEFDSFVESFVGNKDELFSNWTAGAGKDEAVKVFNDFVDNSGTYKKYMKDAEENLGIATSNIEKLAQ